MHQVAQIQAAASAVQQQTPHRPSRLLSIAKASERETAALERHIATQQPVSSRILRYWFPAPFLVVASALLLALGCTALILMWKVMSNRSVQNPVERTVGEDVQRACAIASRWNARVEAVRDDAEQRAEAVCLQVILLGHC